MAKRLGKGPRGAGLSHLVKVRMQPELWQAAKARAAELGVPASSLVRDLTDLALRWSLERTKRKLVLLHGILEHEGRLDDVIRTVGGDPGGVERAGQALDPESIAALVRGSVENPEQTLRLAEALTKLNGELGTGGLALELFRTIVDLPEANRAVAFRQLDEAVAALRARLTLSAAGAKAKA